jgi:hypothetical protein
MTFMVSGGRVSSWRKGERMYVEVTIPYCTTQCNIIKNNYTYTKELIDMLGVSLI